LYNIEVQKVAKKLLVILNIAGSMASSQMCPAHLHLISGKTDGWSDNYQE